MKICKFLFTGLLCVMVFISAGCSCGQKEPEILPGAYDMEKILPLTVSKKIGLVINQASVLNSVNLVDTLLNISTGSGGPVDVRKIFSPEHGFKGTTEAGKYVPDEKYSQHSIPVVSLYGKKKKPSPDDLSDIDLMIFDLQDVGVRFFTYLSTLHYIMEACAEVNVPLVVLDRPNPNGFYIDGPVLDVNYSSFIGLHPVPVVYGMTIGEYARMINGESWLADSLQCELTVVKCLNYTRSSFYNLPLPPSPNLPDMRSVYLYPSTCFFEGTVVSEGRGTDFPFQVIGHPEYSYRTFSFVPRPMPGYSSNPKFSTIQCYGMDLRHIPLDSLQDRGKLDMQYIIAFYNDLALGDKFFTGFFEKLAGNNILRTHIMNGFTAEEIRKSWEEELNIFKKIRVKYLLYPDFE